MADCLLFIHWNPSPDAFSIGTFAIKKYGLLWGAALLCCYFIQQYIFRKLGRDESKAVLAIQYVFIGGLLGARLVHILFYQLSDYIADPIQVFNVRAGGLASHGGLLGGILALYLFCKRNKEFGMMWMLDISAIGVPIMASLIRLGNLFNSEVYGTPTNQPWGFIFEQVDNVPRHPVVLYESIAYLLLQLLMLYFFRKYKGLKPGIYIATLFIGLFATRFMLEFFKDPEGSMILGLISKTQALNIPFIIAGLIFAYYSIKGKLKYGPTIAS